MNVFKGQCISNNHTVSALMLTPLSISVAMKLFHALHHHNLESCRHIGNTRPTDSKDMPGSSIDPSFHHLLCSKTWLESKKLHTHFLNVKLSGNVNLHPHNSFNVCIDL